MWQILWSRREFKESDGLILRMQLCFALSIIWWSDTYWTLRHMSEAWQETIGTPLVTHVFSCSVCDPSCTSVPLQRRGKLNIQFKAAMFMNVNSEAYQLIWPVTIAISSLAIAFWGPFEQDPHSRHWDYMIDHRYQDALKGAEEYVWFANACHLASK
jgi:hypothetical protein